MRISFFSNSQTLLHYLFTTSFNAFPALKATAFLAAICIVSPVCGFLPFLAFLSATLNVPNPFLFFFFSILNYIINLQSMSIKNAIIINYFY